MQILTFLPYIFGAGGIVAALAAIMKIRPEVGQVFVTSAQKAVEAQDTVIENMAMEIKRLNVLITGLQTEISKLNATVEQLTQDNKKLRKALEKFDPLDKKV